MRTLRMAWRNLWRNARRTSVTVTAMTVGLLAMILYSSLMEGMLQGMEQDLLDLEMGDLQVFAGDYRARPDLYTKIETPEELLAPLDAAGFPASARLLAYGMAATDDTSAGVSFRGVDIERDRLVSGIHEQVADGSWIDEADPKGVVIGRRLARMLDTSVGQELVVLTQGADGSFAYDLYRVRGVLRGISDATDRTGIFMTAAAFRELLVVPTGVHQIIVRRPADTELGAAASVVRGLAEDFDVQTWRQLVPTLASMLDSARTAMFAAYFIIYLAIAILILNSTLMAVFERIREFGVLKAIGTGPFQVFALVLAESALQVALAIAIGLLLSIPALFYLTRVGIDMSQLAGVAVLGMAMDPVWRTVVTTGSIVRPVLALCAIVACAVVYPALKAAWISPTQAMRYQ